MIVQDALSRRNLLSLIGVAAASTSVGALVLHALGWLPMYFFIDVVALPSIVLLLLLGVFAHRINEHVFVDRLLSGLWIGLIATLCYDGVRLALKTSGLITFDVFFSHPMYGMLITGHPPETSIARTVGWTYHFWNGINLAIMYTLVAGRSWWVYAVIWSLFLEVAWLLALPTALQFRLGFDVFIVSLIGHSVYGSVLGKLAQRYIKA